MAYANLPLRFVFKAKSTGNQIVFNSKAVRRSDDPEYYSCFLRGKTHGYYFEAHVLLEAKHGRKFVQLLNQNKHKKFLIANFKAALKSEKTALLDNLAMRPDLKHWLWEMDYRINKIYALLAGYNVKQLLKKARQEPNLKARIKLLTLD